jgi:uncharacterized UPF0160 family protein
MATNINTYREFMNWRYDAHTAFLIECLIPKIKAGKTITIGTHNESFHCDEVMAIVMLEALIAELNGEAEIHRIDRKDQEMLDSMDVLVDVGRELDPARGRFDHHQPGGAGRRITRSGQNDIPLSSCGLIWHTVGLLLTGEQNLGIRANLGDDIPMTLAFDKIDRELVRGVDASDNGVGMPSGYRIGEEDGSVTEVPGSPMHLSRMIGQFNSGNPHDHELQFQQFTAALGVARAVFGNALRDAKGFAEARPQLEKAVRTKREQPEVLILDRYLRWSDHLGQVDNAGQIKLVISPLGGEHEEWNLHVVRRRGRLVLPGAPADWCGKEGAALVEASGINGMVFCHGGGHMVRVNGREAALRVAEKLLNAA